MNAKVFCGGKQAARLKPNISGTTLVELIVSIFVFSVVMLGGMSFFTLGQNSEQRANWIDFASSLALNQQQTFFAYRWDQLQSIPGNQVLMPSFSPDQRQFYCLTTISYNTYGSMQIANLHTVVTWDNQPSSVVVDFDTQISSPVIHG
jgi:Tfp pilus assembly protein PilV